MNLQLNLRKQLYDWDNVFKLCEKFENQEKQKGQVNKIAHFAVESSINLGKWEKANHWLDILPQSH